MQRCYGCMREFGKEYDVCPYCGYIVGTEPEIKSHLMSGTQLANRYILGKAIGHGGFGITYIAWDNKIQKTVAIKEYFPNAFSTRSAGETQVSCFNTKSEAFLKEGIRKMLNEAERLSRFSKNENIVDIFDFFEENNTAYIVMEYLEGKDLKIHLEENGGKLAPEKAVEIILPVLNALEDMHKENIIHRDISPDNIFLCDNGRIKLLDFGSARLAVEDSDKSLSVMVKRGYAPKEQYASRSKQGPWTDVYAVCATLYKMITGVLPVESTEREEEAIKKFSELAITGYEELENVVFKGLEVEYKNRIQSVPELREALIKPVQKKPVPVAEVPKKSDAPKVSATPEKTAKQTKPEATKKSPFKINPKVIAAVVAAVVVIVGGIFGMKAIKTKIDTVESVVNENSSADTYEDINNAASDVSEEIIKQAYDAYAAYIAPLSGEGEGEDEGITNALVVDLDKNKVPEVIFTYYGDSNMYILSYGVNDGLSVISPILHSSSPAEVYFSEEKSILYYTDSGHNQGTSWIHEGVCLKATSEGFETVGTVSGDTWDDVSEEIWQDDKLFKETDARYDEAFEEKMKQLTGDGKYTDFFEVCESKNAEKYLEEELSVDFAKKKAEYIGFKEKVISAIGTKPLSIHVSDYDRNGTYEAFAMTGEVVPEDVQGDYYDVTVWFVSREGKVETLGNYDCWTDGEILECQYNDYYQVRMVAGSSSPSTLWMVSEGKCEEIDDFTDKGVDFFKTTSVNGHSNSLVATVNQYDLELEKLDYSEMGIGHTCKYYFYYDTPEGIREYGGTELTEAQLINLGGKKYIDMIKAEANMIYNIYLRENGIININYYMFSGEKSHSCNYINLRIMNNGVALIGNDLFVVDSPSELGNVESEGGLYIAASVPELATYPDKHKFLFPTTDQTGTLAEEGAWKEAYLEVLRNIEREIQYHFWLGYVDNDDIPELFVSEGWTHPDGVEVYSYYNNKAVLLCTDVGSFGGINYIERKGYICGEYQGMGERMCHVYEVKDGTAEMVYSTYDNSGNGEENRTINDVEVSEKEMQEFYDKFYGEDINGFGEEYGTIGYEPTEENYQKYIVEFNN